MTAHPLTWAQQMVWAGQATAPSSALFNQAFSCDLVGKLDVPAFERAYETLCRDVDALRLVFDDGPSGPTQSATGAVLPIEHLRFEDRSAAQDWMENRVLEPFDLETRTTLICLLRVGPEHHILFVLQHHLVTDGRSAGLLLNELSARYTDTSAKAPPAFLPLCQGLQSDRPCDVFDAAAKVPPMQLYGRGANLGTTQKVSVPLAFGPERQAKLRAFSDQNGFQAFTPMLAMQNILATLVAAWLSRVSGQSEVAFSMPQHNRTTAAKRDVIGLFMEMLPLSAVVAEDDTFRSLFERVTKATREMLLNGGPGKTRTDLLRSRNVVLNIFNGTPVLFDGLQTSAQIVPVACSDPALDLDIEFEDLDGSGIFNARMVFDKTRFDEPARARAAAHFLTLMDAFFADPDAQITSVDILTPDEHSVRSRFNENADAPRATRTVVDAFHTNISDAPAVSVSGSDQSMSHRALDEASNQMARLLTDRGVVQGNHVAVHLARSAELVVAILAIHKVGAAFVPVEPSLPSERREFILSDTAAQIVISDTLPDAIRPQDADPFSADEFKSLAHPDGVAYVVYTSGSTGKPKGVSVAHGPLVGYCESCFDAYGAGRGLRYALFTPIGFDLVMNSIFMPLISSGEIVVYPEPESGADLSILTVLERDEVDLIKPTPSHLRLGVMAAKVPLKGIKFMPLSGEAFPEALAHDAARVLGSDIRIINEYGPAEAVVGAMTHLFDPDEPSQGPLVPLGRPLSGMRLCVVNAALQHQPIDVPGEIAIGGRLAEGYLNRPDLTAERFIDDPERSGQKLYLSGDLGVFDALGNLQYLGRMDDQVKLNGVRLELGEVEQAIASVSGVSAAVVCLHSTPAGSDGLVAYIAERADPEQVIDAVRQVLPGSAGLAGIVEMTALPMSSNGKIARGELPVPKANDWLARGGGRPPQTPMEITLVEIFSDVLGLANIGTDDDFYALGGDSLAAVRITSVARSRGYAIDAVDIFRHRTIGQLVVTVKRLADSAPTPHRKLSRVSTEMQAQLAMALGQKK